MLNTGPILTYSINCSILSKIIIENGLLEASSKILYIILYFPFSLNLTNKSGDIIFINEILLSFEIKDDKAVFPVPESPLYNNIDFDFFKWLDEKNY